MNKIFNYLLIISLVIIITPFFSFGQSTSNGNFLEISIIPKNPEPFQTVKTTIKSSLYDLDRSKITWLVDGLEKKTEIGLKEYNTLAGKNGQKTIVKAIVELSDGTKEIETSFTPSLVDLIFESLSYTPPFYKGRALNPSQGSVIVTAIPELVKSNGEKELAQNIFYSWKKDGTPQLPSSGMGKNVLTFTGTVPVRDTIIEVSVSSLDKNLSASKQITIINVDPKIIFYENSPIYGIMLNKGIKGVINMLTDEFSVIAVPYFFNAGYAASPDLKYVWNMNGKIMENQEPKNSFTTRIEKSGAGSANIGLKISNAVRIFQFIENNYTINFQKQ